MGAQDIELVAGECEVGGRRRPAVAQQLARVGGVSDVDQRQSAAVRHVDAIAAPRRHQREVRRLEAAAGEAGVALRYAAELAKAKRLPLDLDEGDGELGA